MPYQVVAVSDQTRPWTSQKGGPMVSYRVHLKDTAGQVSENVELSQKTATPAPQPGQLLEGNIDNGEYGLKFRKAFQQGGGGGGGPRETHPRDARRMGMAHAQEMALKYLEIKAMTGKLKDDFKPGDVNRIANVFAQFVNEAGDQA